MNITAQMIETQGVRPSGLAYWEYMPWGIGALATQSLPTLVFLHGSGEQGHDLELLKAWGLPKLINAGLQLPYRVFCPQCPEGVDWDLAQIAEMIERQLHWERSQVFLTGYSKGATAAWKFAARYAGLLAGVIPVAGRWELADAAAVAAVPVLAIHGALDTRPSPAPMVEAITQHGGEASLWLLAGQGHFISDSVYADPALYAWIESKASGGVTLFQ